MRVLLDESLPHALKKELVGHEVKTVREMNWNGIKNGSLLALAELLFDVFVTPDRSMQYQQNLNKFKIAIVVIKTRQTKMPVLRPAVPAILNVLASIAPGELKEVDT
jgi:Domain of unknown function (DUF5615)